MSTSCNYDPNALNHEDPLRAAFVEMLFALAAAQIGIYFADLVSVGIPLNQPERWLPAAMHLAVGLVLIASSWVGWRQSKSPGMKEKVEFVFSRTFLGLLLDVILVVLYFIVIRQGEIDEKNGAAVVTIATAAPEAMWVTIVFFVYVCWDLLSDVFSKSCLPGWKLWKIPLLCIASTLASWVSLVLANIVYQAAAGQNDWVKVCLLDSALIASILIFRATKVFENRVSRILLVSDCKAFATPRPMRWVDVVGFFAMLIVYAVTLTGAFDWSLANVLGFLRGLKPGWPF